MCECGAHECTICLSFVSQYEWLMAILHMRLVIHNLKLALNKCNYLRGTSLIYHFLWIKGRGKASDVFIWQLKKPLHLPSCNNSIVVNVQSTVITNINLHPTQKDGMTVF
jgi:hypothetical protein